MYIYNTRLNAFLIDLSYVFAVKLLTLFFVNYFLFTNGYYFDLNEVNYFLFFNSFLFLLIFKDFPKHGSIGKQKYGLYLVKNNIKEVSLPYRIIRNIPFLIFFIDFTILKICNNRIGDIILNVKVVKRDMINMTNWYNKLNYILLLFFISAILELKMSNYPFFSFYYDARHKSEINYIQSIVDNNLNGFIYKSDVHSDGKNIKVRLFTKRSYSNDSLLYNDKQKITKLFSSYVDSSLSNVSICFIRESGSRKYFSNFNIGMDKK